MGCKASENRWEQVNSSGMTVEGGQGRSTIRIFASQSGFIRCSATNHRGTETQDKLFIVTGNPLIVYYTNVLTLKMTLCLS